jgi:hypothetical protein
MNKRSRVHNKKRNSALLYEFIIRHISKCLVENRKSDALKALNLSKRFFSENSLLREELNLFNVILQTNVKNLSSAQKIIDSTCRTAAKQNSRKIDEQKSKLIKEINHSFGVKDFYNYKIPNYSIYASIQTLFNESRNKKKILDVASKVKIEESVSDHLTRQRTSTVNESIKVNPNYNNTVYNFLLQRFHKKYENKLTEAQKSLLMQYTAFLISGKSEGLRKSILQESKKIKNNLLNIQDESICADKDLMQKLEECKSEFSTLTFEDLSEQKILKLLHYVNLADEMGSK